MRIDENAVVSRYYSTARERVDRNPRFNTWETHQKNKMTDFAVRAVALSDSGVLKLQPEVHLLGLMKVHESKLFPGYHRLNGGYYDQLVPEGQQDLKDLVSEARATIAGAGLAQYQIFEKKAA